MNLKKQKSAFERITGKSSDVNSINSNNNSSSFSKITGHSYNDTTNNVNNSSKDSSGWLKSSNGNIVETILGTAGDLSKNVGRRFSKTFEGAGDTVTYGLADVLNLFGAKDASDYLKNIADYDQTGHDFGEYDDDNKYTKGINKVMSDNSIAGDKLNEVVGSAGNIIGNIGLSQLGGNNIASSFLASYTTSYGNTRSEAKRNGASDDEANKAGIVSGLAEGISEQIFDGIPFLKANGQIGNKITSKIGSSVEKALGKTAGKIATKIANNLGEGSEEIISNVISAAGNDIVHYFDNNYSYGMENQSGNALQDMWNATHSQASIDSFVSAALSSALFNGTDTIISNNQKNKIVKEYANENKINISEAKNILSNYSNFNYQNTLNQKSNKNASYQTKLDLEEDSKNQALGQMKNGITSNIETRVNGLTNSLKEQGATDEQIQNSSNDLRSKLQDQYVNPGKYQAYQYKETDNQNDNDLKKSFKDIGFNNTENSQELVNRATKLQNDLKTDVRATNSDNIINSNIISNVINEKIKENNSNLNDEQLNFLKKEVANNIGGYVETKNGKSTIYLNKDSKNSLNFVFGHEMTHLFENTDTYKELQSTLYDFAKLNNTYDTERKMVESIYSNGLGNVDNELTSNLTGKLMENEEFIKETSKKPTLFNELYSKVKELYYKATGKQEKAQLEKVYSTFRKVYQKTQNFPIKAQNGTKFMMVGINGVKKSTINDSNNLVLLNKYNEAINMSKNNEDNINIWKKTGWFKDEENNWKLEISDYSAKILNTIEKDKTYKLSSILKHNNLFEAYPDLKNIKVSFKNIKDDIDEKTGKKHMVGGYVTPFNNNISINNKILDMQNKNDIITNTLLHELQHNIQKKEKFNYGYIGKNLEEYKKNLGEREAKETEERRYFKYSERKDNVPKELVEDNKKSLYNKYIKGDDLNETLNSNNQNKIRSVAEEVNKDTKPRLSERTNNKESKEVENTSFNLPTNFEEKYSLSKGDNIPDINKDYFIQSKAISENSNLKNNDKTNKINLENKLFENELNTLPFKNNKGPLSDDDIQKISQKLIEKKINHVNEKISDNVSENAKNSMELSKADLNNLFEKLQQFNGKTKEEIRNSNAKETIDKFVKDHSIMEYEVPITDNSLKELQQEIRKRQFVLGKDYLGEFPDGFSNWHKNNPKLNVKIGEKGNIDSEFKELSEIFPYYLDKNTTKKDMIFVLDDLLSTKAKSTKTETIELNSKDIENASNKMYRALLNNALTNKEMEEFKRNVEEKINSKYARQEVINNYRNYAKNVIGELSLENIHDKNIGILYKLNTMKRNLRDIMNQKDAANWYNSFFKPITKNNAASEITKQYFNNRINKFKLTKEESTYVQMLGEKEYNPDSKIVNSEIDKFYNENKGKIDQEKAKLAVKEFRNIYDELLTDINEVLKSNGYKEIEYRKGYFPHFIEDKSETIIGKLASKLGWNIQKGTLPTDITGITDEFKPGKVWTSFSQRRTGDTTDYNALKGMDKYLNGAMDIIYHTSDIQRLRALENEIRYQFSDKGVQEQINDIYNDANKDIEEKNKEISELTENLKNNPLGNLVSDLRNYTNNLANKKSFSDRSMEQDFGRSTYTIMKNITSRVSANMVGANISSAMTNFIPITQAWGECSTKNLLRGMYESIKTSIKDDGFSYNSTYLINRTKQADKLFKTNLEKINDKLSIPFTAIDDFTSNTIVRAKYYDNIDKGMTNIEAIDNADEFAKDIMAGRSKGDQPTLFNEKNPVVKLFTAFQLEVNNQYGYMFKDIKADLGGEAKDKIALAILKIFLGAFLYNQLAELIVGRKSAFSPIDMAIDDIKTSKNDNLDLGEKVNAIATNTAQELPFVGGIMGGGRLPIQAAIPYDNPLDMVTKTISDASKVMDSNSKNKETAINTLKSEWSKPLFYLGMPFAGGQLKKTIEGLSMYNPNLPTAGSYTESGKLRFEADTSPLGKMQAALFGQYAGKNAQNYFDSGSTPITESQIKEAKDANLPIEEYRNFKAGLKKVSSVKNAKGYEEYQDDSGNNYWYDKENKIIYDANNNKTEEKITDLEKVSSTEQKANYINNLPLSTEQKNSLINSTLNKSEEVKDKYGYLKYKDDNGKTYYYDESTKTLYNSKYDKVNNSKLNSLTKYSNTVNMSNYNDYGSWEEFNYSNTNPEKYSIITQITDYNSYQDYDDSISKISEKYSDMINSKMTSKQKSVITSQKKKAIFNYINGLNLNKLQKLMLYKESGGFSISKYKGPIREYINSLNTTTSEKQKMFDELFN